MAIIAKSKGTPRSIVYVHYTGRLIDGTVFDTTEGDQLWTISRPIPRSFSNSN